MIFEFSKEYEEAAHEFACWVNSDTAMEAVSQKNAEGATRVHIAGVLDHTKLTELHNRAQEGSGISVYPELPREVSKEENTKRFVRAGQLFNLLTGASYYGTHFRQILATDPEAMEAAQKLVDRLAVNKCKGML